jgi:hypothetical protein
MFLSIRDITVCTKQIVKEEGIVRESFEELVTDDVSWLQIQRPRFDFRRYKIFGEIVGLERGPLSLVSTIVELLERKVVDPV